VERMQTVIELVRAYLWEHEDPIIVYLTINGEVIATTPEHPFFTSAGLWQGAGELESGDLVYDADGRTGVVEGVEFIEQPQMMYNLTVAEAHTYFVGDGEWLVHNSNCGQVLYDLARSQNYRGVFFANNSSLREFSSSIIVHHQIPLEVLKKHPGLFSVEELNGAGNLRGIPVSMNNDIHLSQIHGDYWNQFWKDNPDATRAQIEDFARFVNSQFDLDNLANNEFLD
ncbi:MAG: polymorphic toxin-type HINT domain-containing protein, partial [Chloroflexota bacterium]